MKIRTPENKTHWVIVKVQQIYLAQITSDIHLFFLAFAHSTFFSLVFGVVLRCVFGPLHYYVIFFLVQVVFVRELPLKFMRPPFGHWLESYFRYLDFP